MIIKKPFDFIWRVECAYMLVVVVCVCVCMCVCAGVYMCAGVYVCVCVCMVLAPVQKGRVYSCSYQDFVTGKAILKLSTDLDWQLVDP